MNFLRACIVSAAIALGQTPSATANDLPALGDSASGYVSLQQEHDLGRIWLRQLRAQAQTLDDPLLTIFLENIIYRLLPHSGLDHPELEFVILDQANLNAFAVPGGIIGINYGLLLYARDEDEISAVLAHELAHLSQRHYARQVEQAQRQEPVAIATLLASILLIATNNTDAGFAGLMASQAATIQNQLAFSREWEQEADRLGMKTLAESGLDPHAMSSMFEQMLYASRFSARPPEFLLTHPVTESRIADAADRAEHYPKQPRLTSFEFVLLQQGAIRRYQLTKNQVEEHFQQLRQRNPRTSELYAAASYHLANLSFENKQWQQGLNYLAEIAAPWSQHAATVALEAKLLASDSQPEKALAAIDKALPFTPENLLLLTAKASILRNEGQFRDAVSILKQLVEKRPTNPSLWRSLGEAASDAGLLIRAHRANGEYLFYSGQQARALRQMELALTQAKKDADFQQEAVIKQRLQTMAATPTSLNR